MAAWALWSKRRAMCTSEIALPVLSFVAVLLILGLLVAGITGETNYLLYALIIIVALSAITVLQRILFIRAALATTGRRA